MVEPPNEHYKIFEHARAEYVRYQKMAEELLKDDSYEKSIEELIEFSKITGGGRSVPVCILTPPGTGFTSPMLSHTVLTKKF